jgi:hypothetical protein
LSAVRLGVARYTIETWCMEYACGTGLFYSHNRSLLLGRGRSSHEPASEFPTAGN